MRELLGVVLVRIQSCPQLRPTLDGAHKDSVQSVHNPSTEGLSPNSSIGRAALKANDAGSIPALGTNLKLMIMKENSFEDTVIAVCIVGIIAILIIASVANRIGML